MLKKPSLNYPYNLLAVVYGCDSEVMTDKDVIADIIGDRKMPSDFLATVHYVIATKLLQKQFQVVLAKYRDCLSYGVIAKKKIGGVKSADDAKKCDERAICALQSKDVIHIMDVGIHNYISEERHKSYEEGLNAKPKNCNPPLEEKNDDAEFRKPSPDDPVMNLVFCGLIGYRFISALERNITDINLDAHGTDVRIKDVMGFTADQIAKIRGISKTTAIKIRQAVDSYLTSTEIRLINNK